MKLVFSKKVLLLCLFLSVSGVSGTVYGDETGILEQQQAEKDNQQAPEASFPTEDTNVEPEQDNSDKASINSFGNDQLENEMQSERAATELYDLKTNLLEYGKNVDRSKLSFSWKSRRSSVQIAFQINLYYRSGDTSPIYSSAWISGQESSAVEIAGLGESLEDNQLYYWDVQVKNADQSILRSSKEAFVTAAGNELADMRLSWGNKSSSANLMRAKFSKEAGLEKAILTVTAMDTEISKRNVFNVYVNGVEIGLGPTRRNGKNVFYNSYDITSRLLNGDNILGLFAYSQAQYSGLLAQLTYYYQDGTKKVVYNSARDNKMTQILEVGGIVYGNNKQSIGTDYYFEARQNVDTTKFPFDWQKISSFDNKPWSRPKLISWNNGYQLKPSIVDNVQRRPVEPQQIIRNSDGSYTVKFAKEIIGDIQLTASASNKTGIRITMGEEIENGKAKFQMRTGNVYDETWQFKGKNVTFIGYSLKGFRYVTIYNYPGQLTKAMIKGLETNIPFNEKNSFFKSNDQMLNRIYELTKYSYRSATIDMVPDSVTRERRAYEGDNLIYQNLGYTLTDEYVSIRNTWDYLLNNPTQYTDYRLMAVEGIYNDYMVTGDKKYLQENYQRLKNNLKTVTFDQKYGLVCSTNTIDLVDWPRTETPGFDFDQTKYKTAVNMIAYNAYGTMAKISEVLGSNNDRDYYRNLSNALKKNIIEKLYSANKNSFSDGLSASGIKMTNHSIQNNYFALNYEVYTGQKMANQLAKPIMIDGKQAIGSIYSAYFLYQGLYRSGNGDLGTQLLMSQDSKNLRSYASILNSLGATITPEAWSPAVKHNLTYSHVWGSGGGIALVKGIFGIKPLEPAFQKYEIRLQNGLITNSKLQMPTLKGNINVDCIRNGEGFSISTVVPGNTTARMIIPNIVSADSILVDGNQASTEQLKNEEFIVELQPGSHTIVVGSALNSTGSFSNGANAPSSASNSEKIGLYGNEKALQKIFAKVNQGMAPGVNISGSVSGSSGNWEAYRNSASGLATSNGSAIKAVKLKLEGANAKSYDLYYRSFVPVHGWLKWATAGQASGITSASKNLSAFEIKLVKKGTQVVETETNPALINDHSSTFTVRRENVYHFKYSLTSGPADKIIGYGKPNDVTLVGDWDGDGHETLVVRRKNVYYFKNSISGGKADKVIGYGRPGDQVHVGDWNGDGKDTLVVRRGNLYYFKNSISGGEADKVIGYGRPDDTVLVGDWDGDGVDTLAVRRGHIYHIKNSISGGPADVMIGYGRPADEVFVGDWDGDGSDTLAVRRANVFYVKNRIAGGEADWVFGYGRPGDKIYVGKW